MDNLTEKLIEMVQAHPCLFDKRDNQYNIYTSHTTSQVSKIIRLAVSSPILNFIEIICSEHPCAKYLWQMNVVNESSKNITKYLLQSNKQPMFRLNGLPFRIFAKPWFNQI
ncbi:uncharacterized protein LOC118749280 [Rhagoletis pomonella]|uniref:uncharacterized protein LOC118749280 n=1 Tax=Rhagoletis pomonella TaxID=28610 RepID=UPI00177D9174|nr:uncharacterized protein LOC118749280 [Rhagoletis pomonella]